MQLFVKDQSVTTDSNLYIIFLCTIDGKGKEFLNVDLGREAPSEKTIKRLKNIYKYITRPWVVIDMVVEGVEVAGSQPVFFIVDTKLTC